MTEGEANVGTVAVGDEGVLASNQSLPDGQGRDGFVTTYSVIVQGRSAIFQNLAPSAGASHMSSAIMTGTVPDYQATTAGDCELRIRPRLSLRVNYQSHSEDAYQNAYEYIRGSH